MPVCTACGRYWSPRSVPSGRCPVCGGGVAAPAVRSRADAPEPAGDTTTVEEEARKLPWHLKLLAVSFSLYMAYRIYQGVEWLVRHL